MGGVATAALLVAPTAFAATVTSNAIFDGQTQVYGNAGQSVQTDFQVDIPAGQVLHAIRTKVDSQPTVCTEVGPFEGAQVADVDTNITLPPNTNNGGYSLVADLYYTDTLPQAQAMTGDLACTSSVGGSHVNTGAYNGGTVVNVLPTSGSSTGGTGTDASQWSVILQSLQAILAQLTTPATTTPPVVVSSACSQLAQAMVGTQFGVSNSANIALQGFLLFQHQSIPALAAGAAFGFEGQQTLAALSSFKMQNNCQ